MQSNNACPSAVGWSCFKGQNSVIFILSPFSLGVNSKLKRICSFRRKIFSLRAKPNLERLRHPRQQTGCHERCSSIQRNTFHYILFVVLETTGKYASNRYQFKGRQILLPLLESFSEKVCRSEVPRPVCVVWPESYYALAMKWGGAYFYCHQDP